MSKLTNFLQGDMPEDRYRYLTDRLKEVVPVHSLQFNAAQFQNTTPQQQVGRLRGTWRLDRDEIINSGRTGIEKQGAHLVGTALQEMTIARREAMATGLSLRDLRDEYRQMESIITSTLAVQQGYNPEAADDREVTQRLNALENAKRWNKDRLLQQAIVAVIGHVESLLQHQAHNAALQVLNLLQNHIAEALRNLEIVQSKMQRQRRNNPKWAGGDQQFHVDMNHLLHMAALSDDQEITRYADMVSIFSSTAKNKASSGAGASAIGRIVVGEQQVDQVGAFRKWLDDQNKLDDLFAGEIEALLDLAQNYASDYVHNEVKQHSVLDVLLRTGEDVLLQRLREANEKCHALIHINSQFASERREARHVAAFYKNEEQRGQLQRAINQAFGDGQCTLISSKDPSEIVVFYYVDGLPMSSINELTGRCLNDFLKRRSFWTRQSQLNAQHMGTNGTNGVYKQRIGVPIYSGRDAEIRVMQADIIRQLYNVRGQNVDRYSEQDIPELAQTENDFLERV